VPVVVPVPVVSPVVPATPVDGAGARLLNGFLAVWPANVFSGTTAGPAADALGDADACGAGRAVVGVGVSEPLNTKKYAIAATTTRASPPPTISNTRWRPSDVGSGSFTGAGAVGACAGPVMMLMSQSFSSKRRS
jgi:hypothetical protein